MIKNQDDQALRDSQLRTDAEAQLSTVSQAVTTLSAGELLHELQVHQIELEMQNDALRQAQLALADSRDRYVDLYEFAPVGYLTLNADGIIAEINLTGVTLLGKERKLLLHKSFRSLVVSEDQDRWVRYFLKAIKQDEPGIVDLRVRRGDGMLCNAQLHCVRQNLMLRISFIDVTEQKKIENALTESEQAFRLTFNQAAVGIARVSTEGKWLDVNQKFCDIVGYSKAELLTRTFQDITHPDDMAADLDYLQQMLAGQLASIAMEKRYLHKSGETVWVNVTVGLAQNSDGTPKYFIAVVENISARKQSDARLEKLAHFDQLTNLPNRLLLINRAEFALSLAQRHNEQLTVMFLDLDHFKDINDTLGHSIGDLLLIEVAKRLKAALREEDTVARQGGDEFILILPDTDAQGAARVAGKLIEEVCRPVQAGQHEINISASIGISIYPHDGEDLETLSKNADAAMYRTKHEGRNGYRFYTAAMQELSIRNMRLGNELRHALARNELTVHYQPQLSIQDGHIVGAEALLRWQHPELGNISPAEFIPIAEGSGQILKIGEWVLRTAVSQLTDWMARGLPPMIMAVNLSAVQFRQEKLPELVVDILHELGLPPQYLELELTEAVAMDDPLGAIAVMDKLHGQGIRMSIDDFGTGYSSLSYLKRFKVYKLKIDQSFVRDIISDSDDKAIVTAIINMASSLGMQTIAEGVETAGQLAFLRLQGCDEVQGYYFSKPLPAERFEQFVRKTMDIPV